MEQLITSPTTLAALGGLFLLMLALLRMRRIQFDIHMLVNIALLLGLALILHEVRIFHMPQGGSVTLGGMVPLLLLAYRYGPASAS